MKRQTLVHWVATATLLLGLLFNTQLATAASVHTFPLAGYQCAMDPPYGNRVLDRNVSSYSGSSNYLTCRDTCLGVLGCTYYTYNSSIGWCTGWKTCDTIIPTSNDTVTYDLYPTMAVPANAIPANGSFPRTNCSCMDSPPRANVIMGMILPTGQNATDCQDMCKAQKDPLCKYATFYPSTNWCSIFRDCEWILPKNHDSVPPQTFKTYVDPAPQAAVGNGPYVGYRCAENEPAGNQISGKYLPPNETATDCHLWCEATAGCGAYTWVSTTSYCSLTKTCTSVIITEGAMGAYQSPCSPGTFTCPSSSTCKPTGLGLSNYTCVCPTGYNYTGTNCTNINECLSVPSVCGSIADTTCQDTDGGYFCIATATTTATATKSITTTQISTATTTFTSTATVTATPTCAPTSNQVVQGGSVNGAGTNANTTGKLYLEGGLKGCPMFISSTDCQRFINANGGCTAKFQYEVTERDGQLITSQLAAPGGGTITCPWETLTYVGKPSATSGSTIVVNSNCSVHGWLMFNSVADVSGDWIFAI